MLVVWNLLALLPFIQETKSAYICTGNGVFNAAGNLCFYPQSQPMTYVDANAFCAGINGTLAPVKSGFDNAVVVSEWLLKDCPCHLPTKSCRTCDGNAGF